jgi:hypothetical protein
VENRVAAGSPLAALKRISEGATQKGTHPLIPVKKVDNPPTTHMVNMA